MDIKKFREIKRRSQLTSHPVVQPDPNSELGVASELQPELVDRTKPRLNPELQLSVEPEGYLESVAMIEREHSIGGSGWGYSQLLKEFRE